MAPSPSSSGGTTSVQVALRIRPTTTQDTNSIPARFQRTVVNAISPTSVSIDPVSSTPSATGSSTAAAPVSSAASKKQTFTFDQVHPPATTQHAMFTSTAKPLISRFVEGFNCTILAYGQTSSGKTFTMTGIDLDADPSDPSNGMGIIPRSVSTIFARCRELKEERGGTWNFSIKGSYIEIYNEDLIDLLSPDEGGGGKRDVQIREDKQGHIIWEGLREVSVKNSNEVMNLIRRGAAIRRTNETDMNAQSSRSHAIFSLTLTQKKFTGSGPPPRSSSPLPPSGRSPSRLARPGSVYSAGGSGARVSSPTFGRPPTPSFHSAIARGGARPASSLGLLTPDGGRSSNLAKDDDEPGEWVTVVSKFHFVDLAGSERLKRTAAAGERIKEGISINSGLLALGNVISALGDPARAKSHTATYIPYRDSKLTRLLQDSLGGNAHTLMIACVSPAEWNAAETANTLKYANRARNIKNRAVISEKEEGWDDIEWLQGMVTRLRKEVKQIKEGGGISINATTGAVSDPLEGAGKKVLAQMADLQNNYEDLREKFVERTEELTRLRRDLAEKERSSKGGHIGGTAKYEEIVGPVIEEYEKTISAMEAELSLNRAALRHTNEMFEEKEAEYSELAERHSTTEMYVEELRSRVAKLTEREASTEAYIHDLEEKVKHYDESTVSSSGSITDLKREISKYKDTESHSSHYIAELELRLSRSDESVLALRETVERLEQECSRRREEAESFQARLEALTKDGQSWRDDLEERERKVLALEQKMAEWEAKKKEANQDRERLGELADEVSKARKELETSSIASSSHPASETASINEPDRSVEAQLVALQQTHTATLADLSSVTAKYRDSLREIADLAAQLQEARVSAPVPLSEVSESPERVSETPSPRRRLTRDGSDTQTNGTGRRLVYRQPGSTESLRARSLSQSVSLSQELSSARSRKLSTSSHTTSSSVSLSPTHSISRSHSRVNLSLSSISVNPNERSHLSLEQEIMRLQEVLKEREAEITALETSLRESEARERNGTRTPSESAPATPVNGVEPSVHVNGNGDVTPNGETDAMFHLSPKTRSQFQALRRSLDLSHSQHAPVPDHDESLDRLNELMRSMAQKESSHQEVVDKLETELTQVRRQYDELHVLSRDQTLNMATEIEALQNKRQEDLAELEQIKQREAELVETLRKAEADHAAAIEDLKQQHEEALRVKEAEVDALVARLKEEHDGEIRTLRDQVSDSSSSLDKNQEDHQSALAEVRAKSEAQLSQLKDEHEVEVRSLRDQLSDASAALEKAHQEHKDAFGDLRAKHEDELNRRNEDVNALLERTRQEHEESLSKAKAEHDRILKQTEELAAATLHRTEEEYYEALTKLRSDYAAALEKQTAEHTTAIQRLKDDHTNQIRVAEIAREGSLSESQSARDVALKELQEAHAAVVAQKESQFTQDLQTLKDEHAQALQTKDEQHRASVQRLKADHSATLHEKEAVFEEKLEQLQKEHEKALQVKETEFTTSLEKTTQNHQLELEKLQLELSQQLQTLDAELTASKEALESAKSAHVKELEEVSQTVKEQHADILAEVARSHEEELEKVKGSHQAAISDLQKQAEDGRSSLIQSHTEEVLKLRSEHQAAIAELQASLIAAQEEHRQDLDASRSQTERLLSEEKKRLSKNIAELEAQHAAERETMHKDHELLLEEVASYKAASDEFAIAREEMRANHQLTLAEKNGAITNLQEQLTLSNDERDNLKSELAQLRAELDNTRSRTTELVREASKRDSLVEELDKHRSLIADLQNNLQKTKDEMDNLQLEKSKQEIILRELQAQLMSRSPSPGQSRPMVSVSSRANGLPPAKLPPLSPPPAIPPPPTPRSIHDTHSSVTSTILSASSSRSIDSIESPSTPATSIHQSVGHGVSTPGGVTPVATSAVDPKLITQVQEQAKQLDEQEAMIKTLNKQLTHCEGDLQAHMDLVARLETSLADSEKNLRKARMQATEMARERDNLTSQVTSLRTELHEAKNEVVSVRRSIVEEKQSLESRLDEERRAKERARAQLDARMDELQRRKSKFACL